MSNPSGEEEWSILDGRILVLASFLAHISALWIGGSCSAPAADDD